jgi:hypothetical protein
VPGLQPATWVLQVMPVFFFVGGYVKAASWASVRQRAGGFIDFLHYPTPAAWRPPRSVNKGSRGPVRRRWPPGVWDSRRASSRGVSFPGDQCGQNGPPGDPQPVGGHHRELDAGSRILSNR